MQEGISLSNLASVLDLAKRGPVCALCGSPESEEQFLAMAAFVMSMWHTFSHGLHLQWQGSD